jgi:hypothetical protein
MKVTYTPYTLHISSVVDIFFYFKRKNQSRFLTSDSVLDPVKVNDLSEAHCDRQKSPSHNLTLPFMTSDYLCLLHRGEYSSHNDTVTKNKEIYSSLTILNYCQQWYGLLPFIKLWQETRKRTGKKQRQRWIYCVGSMKIYTDGQHAKWPWNIKPVSLECTSQDADTYINWANK